MSEATSTPAQLQPRQSRPEPAGRLALVGGLAVYDVARVKPLLIEAVERHSDLEIDLSAVESIDTAGIQLLMLAKVHAGTLEHRLQLVGHSPVVTELFDLFRLAGYFGDPVILPSGNEARRPMHMDVQVPREAGSRERPMS